MKPFIFYDVHFVIKWMPWIFIWAPLLIPETIRYNEPYCSIIIILNYVEKFDLIAVCHYLMFLKTALYFIITGFFLWRYFIQFSLLPSRLFFFAHLIKSHDFIFRYDLLPRRTEMSWRRDWEHLFHLSVHIKSIIVRTFSGH